MFIRHLNTQNEQFYVNSDFVTCSKSFSYIFGGFCIFGALQEDEFRIQLHLRLKIKFKNIVMLVWFCDVYSKSFCSVRLCISQIENIMFISFYICSWGSLSDDEIYNTASSDFTHKKAVREIVKVKVTG